jgi:hypothetical protein
MALPLSLWRRESDLLLLTVRAPDKRASSRLVRVPDTLRPLRSSRESCIAEGLSSTTDEIARE